MSGDIKQELHELFSMFHDFRIVSLSSVNKNLSLTIAIPWGELWDDLNYQIRLELDGCDSLICNYSECINTNEHFPTSSQKNIWVDKITNDHKLISELELEVQSHEFSPPNKYVFKCNSSRCISNNPIDSRDLIGGGELFFTTESYSIFDKDWKQIDLNKMKKWCAEWWDKIDNQ
jgi:hypothetical protein